MRLSSAPTKMALVPRLQKSTGSFLLLTLIVILLAILRGDSGLSSLESYIPSERTSGEAPSLVSSDHSTESLHRKVAVPFGETPEFGKYPLSGRANDPPAAFTKFLPTGQKLMCLLPVSIAAANAIQSPANSQSIYTSYADLAANGWNKEQSFEPISDGALDDAFEGVSPPIDTSSSDYVTLETYHTLPYSDSAGVSHSGTGAYYKNIYYRASPGSIIADDNKSPRNEDANAKDWVSLQSWSDVAFLHWQLAAGSAIRSLTYVFRATISNDATVDILDYAIQSTGNVYGTFEDRVTFGMDTELGQAILGSPNGNGVGWLLINHKQQLGVKTVVSVDVWVEDPDAGTLERSILFTFKSLDQVQP